MRATLRTIVAVCCVVHGCAAGAPGRGTPSGAAGAGGTRAGGAAGAAAPAGASGTSGAAGDGGPGGQAGGSASAGTSGDASTGASGGATAGTGGAPDAATPLEGGATDAPVGAGDASTPSDACAALFCDDFESYSAPSGPGGPWKLTLVAGGTVSVDTTHAHSGKNAVHVMNPGGAANERAVMGLEGAPLFPMPHNTFFGRMMIYVARVPSKTVHWTIIQGEGAVVPGYPTFTQAVYRYGGQINGNLLMSNYDTKPSGVSDCAQRSQVPVPMNRWACVEWRFDGENKELDFWLDGTIIPALSVRQKAVPAQGACQNQSWSGIWEPPIFDAIRVGWQHYQQGPGEAWIDDVAIDTKRVGCPGAP